MNEIKNIVDIRLEKKIKSALVQPPQKPKTEYSDCSDLRKERKKIIDSFERSIKIYEEDLKKH